MLIGPGREGALGVPGATNVEQVQVQVQGRHVPERLGEHDPQAGPGELVYRAGQGELEQERAAQLAELGYVGLAMDVYGKGKRGASTPECQALMKPLADDLQYGRLSRGGHVRVVHKDGKIAYEFDPTPAPPESP